MQVFLNLSVFAGQSSYKVMIFRPKSSNIDGKANSLETVGLSVSFPPREMHVALYPLTSFFWISCS